MVGFAAGALFVVAHPSHGEIAWTHGIGYAAIPLTVYLVVFRAGRPHYALGVVAVSFVNAISGSLAHSYLALFSALVLSALVVGFSHVLRIIPALLALLAFVLLNWHETLYALMSVVPLTEKGGDASPLIAGSTLAAVWSSAVPTLWTMVEILLAAAVALGILFWNKRPLFYRMSGVLALCVGGAVLLSAAPWRLVGLGALENFNFLYLLRTLPTLAVIVIAGAAGRAWTAFPAPRPGRFGPDLLAPISLAPISLALAVGSAVYYKAYHGATWLSEGGQKALYRPGDIDREMLTAAPPARVVTVPYRLSANGAAAAGLDTFDGVFNLSLRPYAAYWKKGLIGGEGEATPNFTLEAVFDPKCCMNYDLDRHLNTNLLRVANVGYVLSVLPLIGRGLRQVAGPDGPLTVPRSADPAGQRLSRYLKMMFEPNPVRVYALSNSLPRVFAARKIMRATGGMDDEAFLDLIARNGIDRTLVVRKDLGGIDVDFPSSLRIRNFDLVENGFTANLEAPGGGIVVFNVTLSPFWRARVDGRPAEAFAANMIHAAVPVPPGARRVSLSYGRPLLRERMLSMLGFGKTEPGQ